MSVTRKIRFIEPNGRRGRPFNAWLARWPLLGPITLATILEKHDYDVAVYNENISGSLLENPAALEDICSADVVGISIMTPTAARGYELADEIKRFSPGVTIAFGGIHATFMSAEALPHGDIVVRGEGENAIEAIAAGEAGKGIINAPPVRDLDTLPTLNHQLVRDFDRVMARLGHRELYELPVMSSRGCPYDCTFCSVSRMFGRSIRRQSVEKVYRDLASYVGQGFRQFFFYDDNFTANRAWLRELMQAVAPLRVRFDAQTRADFPWVSASRDQVDQPLLGAMRQGGAHVLYIGYETVDEETASEWHKCYRGKGPLRERLLKETEVLHDSGFWIHGMFVFGPRHSERTADQIVEFARESKLESIQISVLTPLPGTPLMEEMRPHLVFTDYPDDWDYYDGAHCVYDHSRLGIRGVQETVLQAHRNFYRGYGWRLRRIRDGLRERVSVPDRLALLYSNARVARRTLKQWEKEINSFLKIAASKQRNNEQLAREVPSAVGISPGNYERR